ncbi:MAG TPA: glycosyltransferase family 39 protein [Polyangiaceae bacterium]|nr:glycosyltransferase family 39 protein [Polyangiaceae bacterium]
MKPADRRLERVCKAVAALASVGFALAAFWELGDTFGAGHFAAASAVCTAAENIWTWGLAGPVTHALAQPPAPGEFYCHHPWGIFWVSALFMKVFGHHAWACRLPAVLQSAFTVPALYFAGRALWGPVAGAVAAVSFAVLPIALGFSDFNALEVPAIFGTLLAIWGYARFRQSYRTRDAGLSLAGLIYGICADWPVVIFGASMLGAIFVSAFVLRRWAAPVDRRRIATFWALAVASCALVIGAQLYAFAQLGQLSELFAQGGRRSAGVHVPLALVLAARKFWIEVSFTGLAIALGKFALPVLGLRMLLRRTELEALPLAVLGMALFQYVVFKQGAGVHIFWPHYFALYFALACAALAQSALDLLRLVSQKWPRLAGPWPTYGVLGAFLLLLLTILPDGLRALGYAHRSGGRFNENGRLIKPDKDKVAALEWLSQRWAPNTGVILHPGMRQSLWVDWSLQRPVTTSAQLPSGPGAPRNRYYVADLRFMSGAEQDTLAANFSLTALGPFLAIDRAKPAGDLRAFDIERREPSALEAYWVSSSHALRNISSDPFLTWELKDRFELSHNLAPTVPPKSFEQLRIAHNIAVSRGDAASASHFLEALLTGGDRSRTIDFGSGNTLLGTRLEHGSSLVFSVYIRAAGADPREPELVMHSQITKSVAGSWVDPDTTLAEVGMPFTIPANRWKSGYVYSSVTEVIRRIGSERWYGQFRTRGALGTELSPGFEVLRLE